MWPNMDTILGIKKGMSVRFDEYGRRLAVTLVVAEPNVVIGLKDGRSQLGLGTKKKVKKPDNAYLKKLGFVPRYLKTLPKTELDIDPKITVSIFQPQDEVKVTGTTRGRGFAGGVKRWGFAGGPKTHGQSNRHRAPGSIGQTTTPGRVFKGKKMAGHMGAVKLTITGKEVVEVDPQNNLLVLKGPVPGAKNSLLLIKKTGKVKSYQPQKAEIKDEPKEEEKNAQS